MADSEGKLPVFNQSEKMIHLKVNACAYTDEQLKAMDIDRRWSADNRIPTWTFGMVNFGFDQKFLQNGGIIDDTDDRVQPIWSPDTYEVTGYRRIVHNGNWLKVSDLK